MATPVHFHITVPASDGSLSPTGGVISCTPTLRRTEGDAVVLPEAVTVALVEGEATVSLAATEATWCWKITDPGGTAYVLVPDSATTVEFVDLVEVDPSTLTPSTGGIAAWTAVVEQAETAAADAAASAATAAGASDAGIAALVADATTATAAAAGMITAALPEGATPAATLAALQAAITSAATYGLGVRIPAGEWHISGGSILVASTTLIEGLGALSIIHQDTFPLPIFKVTGADVTIQDLALEGEGLDATGFPLYGDDSFRQHVGVWLDRSGARPTVRRVTGSNLAMVVSVGDPRPYSPTAYGSTPLADATIEDITGQGVWCVVSGGYADGLTINRVTGQWELFTGTPSEGDVGSPAHCVYISADADHMSSRVSISNVSASGNTAVGSLLKVKHTTGLETSNISSVGGNGGMEFEELYDSTLAGLQVLSDNYPDTGTAYGRGTIWLVSCYRVTLDKPVVSFAAGAHGTAIYVETGCVDVTLRQPRVTTNRTTATGVPPIAAKGTSTVVDRAVIRSNGAGQLEEAISVMGAGSRIISPDIDGTHLYGVNVEPTSAPIPPIFIEYDPMICLPSRTAGPGSLSIRKNSNAANTVMRDLSIGQTVTAGILETFDRADATSLGYTDDLKGWGSYGVEGFGYGNWVVSGNAGGYNGGSARAIALVDGGKADGTFTAVIGTLPINDEGVVVRGTDANNHIAVVPYYGSGDYRVKLIKRVAGSASLLATSTATAVAGDTLAVVLSGTSVSVNLNGTQIITPQTITDFSTITKHGLLGSSSGKVFRAASLVLT